MPSILDALLTRLALRLAPRVRDQLTATLVGELDRHIEEWLMPALQRRAHEMTTSKFFAEATQTIAARLADRIEDAASTLFRNEASNKPLLGSVLYLPTTVVAGSQPEQYMSASIPLTRDFLHPEFLEFARLYGLAFELHRKNWEWAFIYEHLKRAGALQPGKRGLGFGVGMERLPALFAQAGVYVTATDTPSDDPHWRDSGQYGGSREHLFAPHIISREAFEERVSFEPCDMTRLPEHLTGYDFCWSSCCFEHLGDLQRGLDFVIDSTERSLVVGGVACHTTEFNLSSDDATIESGHDVIYRKQDLLRLCRTLEERGHQVEPLRIDTGNLVTDCLVDVPPYRKNPHLKLLIGDFVATSIGLVIRRGR